MPDSLAISKEYIRELEQTVVIWLPEEGEKEEQKDLSCDCLGGGTGGGKWGGGGGGAWLSDV